MRLGSGVCERESVGVNRDMLCTSVEGGSRAGCCLHHRELLGGV